MTIESRYNDLIQAAIDGELRREEKADLDAFLAQSEEGRALYDEFEALARSLDAIGELEPPEQLQHLINNAVPAVSASRRRRGFFAPLFSGPALGYAGTFAAGAVLSLALISSDRISTMAFDDVTGLVGTIADLDNVGGAHSVAAVDKNALAGTVTLRSSGTLLILDFDLSAREPVDILARYSDQTIWFNGFAQLESNGTSVAAESGTVRLHMNGKRRYAVFLNNPGNRPTTIELTFLARGDVIHEARLVFGQ